MRMRHNTYIWSREFTRERLMMLERLQSVHQNIMDVLEDPPLFVHYNRYQWLGECRKGQSYTSVDSSGISASLWGRPAILHLQLVTAWYWSGLEVYLEALCHASERYPRGLAYQFLSGARVGERVMEFTSEEYELHSMAFWQAVQRLTEHQNYSVGEQMLTAYCNTLGHTHDLDRWPPEDGLPHYKVTVICNTAAVDASLHEHIKDKLVRGLPLGLDATPTSHLRYDDMERGLVELSGADLVWLNWVDVCQSAHQTKPACVLNLEAGIAEFNLDRVRQALAQGAEVNGFTQQGSSYLSTLYDRWRGRCSSDTALGIARLLLEQGVHPDLHSPYDTSVLVDAAFATDVAWVRLLLAHGALASVRCFPDDMHTEWPPVWENARFDAFNDHNEDALHIFELLSQHRTKPFV